jgi:hypothetical protein
MPAPREQFVVDLPLDIQRGFRRKLLTILLLQLLLSVVRSAPSSALIYHRRAACPPHAADRALCPVRTPSRPAPVRTVASVGCERWL